MIKPKKIDGYIKHYTVYSFLAQVPESAGESGEERCETDA